MNKYQEAFNSIIKNSYLNSLNRKDYNIVEAICYRLVKDKIDLIQELIDKQEKYKWHNVGFDKNDVPKNDIDYGLVEVCFVGLDGILQYEKASYNKDKNEFDYISSCVYGNTVEAWRLTEEFEDE